MSYRGSSGRGGRRNYSGGRGNPSARKRGAFTKLLKDEDAQVTNAFQAKRFVEGMETFESKVELLSKLEDTRNMGMQRIRDVLSWINSSDDVEMLLIPMLQQVMNDETARPLYRLLRNKILFAVFTVPGLMDALVGHQVAEKLGTESAEVLAVFLLAVAKAFVEARMSDQVLQLAKTLRDRGDIDDANTLCAVILADRDPSSPSQDSTEALSTGSAACWVTDRIPPGGRHDNDHLNYRNIKIVPTVEELRCTAKPWLPLASGENHIIEDPEIRLLDGSFRLLREDAVNTMKEKIAEQSKPWPNARVVGLDLSGKGTRGASLSFVVQCDNRPGGTPNWTRSRALMHGTVVAFCQEGVPKRLGTITVREHEVTGEWLNAPGGPKFGVVFDSQPDFTASLDEMLRNGSMNERLCELISTESLDDRKRDSRIREVLEQIITYDIIEASKSFFSYQPILQTLQCMEGVPLMDELVGLGTSTNNRPSYLPERVILPQGENFRGYICDLDNLSSSDLADSTSLDLSQAEALYHALTSKVSLIQGPPGCGKTFIGALIAQVIRNNTDESILCVCYTNHALDQFLEHMLDAGEERIVRIGGRSKSPRISKYQLKELARQKERLGESDTRRLRQVDAQLHKHRELIGECIAMIKSPVTWTSPSGGIKGLLRYENPDIFACLRVPHIEDGFDVVGPNGKKLQDDFLWKCWRNGDGFPVWLTAYLPTVLPPNFDTFWNAPRHRRLAMYETWRRDILGNDMDSLHDLVETFNTLNQEKKTILQEKELQVLRNARIVGATTTGAAQYRDLLASKGAGVVMVEEAGEVLEAHTLTALAEGTRYSDETEHLILIGDHKQLRPKVENYELTTVSEGGYNLDCSLFERLVLSNRPSVALEVQHRMRPEISNIIRTQTYPSLRDHESVHLYPNIRGVTRNVVFINHRFPEDGEQQDEDHFKRTKSNYREAELCIELVRFLLLQGYSPDSIVILTPYLGQLLEIIHLVQSSLNEVIAFVSEHDQQDLDENLEADGSSASASSSTRGRNGIRCSSVDNFQGEEADIIVVSLVRSNKRGSVGFLKEEQRVNVLLSRARHGMFLLGNASTLRQSRQGRKVWNQILSMLDESGQFLSGLPTFCQLHPDDDPIELCTPSDFRTLRPNGGCNRPCTFRMQCGHVCPLTCHPVDQTHEVAQKECCEPCRRFPPECNQGHTCPKLCKDQCGPCMADVGPVTLVCGHVADSARCHDVRSSAALEAFSERCSESVLHEFANCGHKVETLCRNARSSTPVCPAKCSEMASCGHPCANICGTCEDGHTCHEKCERMLFCGHVCGRPCHEPGPCKPCKQSCSVACTHSQCPKKCNEPCPSCIEPCDWVCEHRERCPLVCGAPCSRLPCDERCTETLSCGHRCPTVCGEPCPAKRFCQECGPSDIKASIVDLICCESYEDHDVDADPIVCLPCGHIYSISTLDGHLGLSEVYSRDERSASWTGLKRLRDADVSEKPKCCPDCRSGIHSIKRYGRLLRLIELRSLERKHLMLIDRTLDVFSRPGVEGLVKKLTKILKTIERSPMQAVYEACQASEHVEVPPPPARPLIRALQLLGRAYEDLIESEADENYMLSKDTYERAIVVATASMSVRSGALLRISLSTLLMKWDNGNRLSEKDVYQHLDWIVDNAGIFPELVARAKELKHEFSDRGRTERAKVIAAMEILDGYNYGGSWSSHWYQCPNGHPYFIGECGGAMQESRCPDCGERVGGSSHRLLSTNRSARDIVASIRQGNR